MDCLKPSSSHGAEVTRSSIIHPFLHVSNPLYPCIGKGSAKPSSYPPMTLLNRFNKPLSHRPSKLPCPLAISDDFEIPRDQVVTPYRHSRAARHDSINIP